MSILYHFSDTPRETYWQKISIFRCLYPPYSRLKPPQGGFTWDVQYDCWSQKKLDFLGYSLVKTAWSYGHQFWPNTSVWQTDRQTRRLCL